MWLTRAHFFPNEIDRFCVCVCVQLSDSCDTSSSTIEIYLVQSRNDVENVRECVQTGECVQKTRTNHCSKAAACPAGKRPFSQCGEMFSFLKFFICFPSRPTQNLTRFSLAASTNFMSHQRACVFNAFYNPPMLVFSCFGNACARRDYAAFSRARTHTHTPEQQQQQYLKRHDVLLFGGVCWGKALPSLEYNIYKGLCWVTQVVPTLSFTLSLNFYAFYLISTNKIHIVKRKKLMV